MNIAIKESYLNGDIFTLSTDTAMRNIAYKKRNASFSPKVKFFMRIIAVIFVELLRG